MAGFAPYYNPLGVRLWACPAPRHPLLLHLDRIPFHQLRANHTLFAVRPTAVESGAGRSNQKHFFDKLAYKISSCHSSVSCGRSAQQLAPDDVRVWRGRTATGGEVVGRVRNRSVGLPLRLGRLLQAHGVSGADVGRDASSQLQQTVRAVEHLKVLGQLEYDGHIRLQGLSFLQSLGEEEF